MIKKWILVPGFFFTLFSCAVTDYNPQTYMSEDDKDSVMRKIIRYLAKAPENISDADRFNSRYDDYYNEKLSVSTLEQFYKNGNEAYFLVSQPASGLTMKRHATGGRIQFNNEGDVLAYEEIFRTWKMTPDTLRARSYFLFDKMISGESLKPYWTKNSRGVDFIELPDDRNYFDIASRQWKNKRY